MKKIQVYDAKKNGSTMLNANESYCNLSDEILREIQEVIPSIAFNRYPDETSAELIQVYGAVMKIAETNILAGNGSDEMLGLLINYFLGKGKKLFTLAPDFSMYDYYVTMQDAIMVKYLCKKDGSFDVMGFIEYGREKKVNMILFSNPNNPTGHTITNKELCKIVEAFPTIPVIIDEAYAEFSDETMLACIDQYHNLYVTRTLSKAFGLAGARLGFLISNKRNIAQLKPMMVPYNISSITQKIGCITLAHSAEFAQRIEEIKQARDCVYRELCTYKSISVYPSKANYIFGRVAQKEKLLAAFEKEGIIIRTYGDDSFRLTIGSAEENRRVCDIIAMFDKEETSNENSKVTT